ncbi:MAG: SGNH/GDSL hydrolase family protein [Bacteroidota bacterium]
MKKNKQSHRRNFLRKTLWGTGLFMGLPGFVSSQSKPGRKLYAKPGKVLLFQGDSITDARRNKKDNQPNTPHGLGSGYVNLIASELLGQNVQSDLNIYNRGISGNKVFQLADRWQADCLDIQPDVLTILIGVNDFWHKMKHGYKGTVAIYESDYRKLLEQTLADLPEVQLILCEPFMIPGGTAIEEGWPEAFAKYQEKARGIAKEFNARFIPYQRIFDEALEDAEVSYWCPDGVHPGPAGNYLMAQAWLDVYKDG